MYWRFVVLRRMAEAVRRRAHLLGRWWVSLGLVATFAALVLLPGLGWFGIWEPQERTVADRWSPRPELEAKQTAQTAGSPVRPPPPPGAKAECERIIPKDAVARSLSPRAAAWGRDTFGDSDAGRRTPFALLGLITVLAIAGTAMRLGGARAGLIAGLVGLSFPLLTLQSRQLTSEIGTPAAASLIVYGLVALGRGRGRLGIIEAIVAVVALAGGVVLGFIAGGALLGFVVPIGAYAAAGALGVPGVITLSKLAWQACVRVSKRTAIGRTRSWRAVLGEEPIEQLKVLLATAAAITVIAVLAYQLYDLSEPKLPTTAPQRELFGKVISPSACYSSWLGGIWKTEDEIRFGWDSTFEQIAYGTFPWGLLAPIAFASLLASADRSRRLVGAICLAWAGGAWIATEAFQRKVGFTIWSGFPPLAIGIGVWLDGLLDGRARDDRDAMPSGALLIGLFAVVGVLDFGKDLISLFAENRTGSDKLTSLLVESNAIQYPTQSRFLFIPTRLWVLGLGELTAIAFAISLSTWRAGTDQRAAQLRRISTWAVAVMFALTAGIGIFWSAIWQPHMATHLSSKSLFGTYNDLVEPGDQLVINGDLGDAPYDYSDTPFQAIAGRPEVIGSLARPNRVFAVVPRNDLCAIHREVGGHPYFLIDDRNSRSMLLSNKVDGTTDKNPLREMILHAAPTGMAVKAKSRIVFENKIQLIGWSVPARAERGERIEMTFYYQIIAPVGTTWKTIVHVDGHDGQGRAAGGDHEPINNVCPTSTWMAGDYIVDKFSFVVGAGAHSPGNHDVFTGFFTGTSPNFTNMKISEVPKDMRAADGTDRVKIATIVLD